MIADSHEIYLEYGETPDGQAQHISEARPGLECGLSCPYCGGVLVAKNRQFSGRIKQPHFAHDSETCRYISQYSQEPHFRIPLYQNFTWNLRLSKNQRAGLQVLYREFGRGQRIFVQRKRKDHPDCPSAAQELYLSGISNCHQVFNFLKKEGFITALPEDHQLYQLSNKGLIANGGLALAQFYGIQRQAIDYERTRLEDALVEIKGSRKKADRLRRQSLETDRKIFEWTLKRFARSQLYFLELELADSTIHKIGITQRPIEERLSEIQQDLKELVELRSITPLQLLPKMSMVEPYFLLRFHQYQHKFSPNDPHHEYFQFQAEELEQASRELQQLTYQSEERREKIKAGMQEAKAAGKRIGRPADKLQKFLQKPKSQEIAVLIERGHSLREVQRRTGYAINTIRKVNDTIRAVQASLKNEKH